MGKVSELINKYEDMTQEIRNGKTSLGIEFGSTRIKAVLINNQFETIATGSYDWENLLENGYWTYNILDIITGLQAAYRDLMLEVEKQYGVTIRTVGAIGISAMMHGYMAFDKTGELLVPFRTWRNTTTSTAAKKLTKIFQYNIPERWSVAHLYQAILNKEKHLEKLDYMTTLAGHIHWLLTGEKIIGIGDASGMFPIDESQKSYKESMIRKFNSLISDEKYSWSLKDILPQVKTAGEKAGRLTEIGAKIIDQSRNLQPGIPFCPPEGDAGTGMIATNSIKKRSGNVSVGTSIFAMVVLEKELSKVHEEIDLVTTPNGSLVGMVHANNCSSDLNAWLKIFQEFSTIIGKELNTDELFEIMLNKSLEADADGGGLLSYGYLSGENITGLEQGRPLFVRTPESNFNLANFMKTHLLTAFGALKIGMDILIKKENVQLDSILAHGGLFKTPLVGQKVVAAALNVPVSVMSTASEGGAWGIAVLAKYLEKSKSVSLDNYLDKIVFEGTQGHELYPDNLDVQGFESFLERYKNGLAIEQSAVDNLIFKTTMEE